MHPPMPALAAEDVDTDPDRPLVVGYVSPDLFTHSVSYFAEAPLALHNPARHARLSLGTRPEPWNIAATS